MERADQNLAFMLQYENIAWFSDGEVRILDRRCYPAKTEFVRCKHHREVAQAITDMVTQSAGPYTAAPMGMALAAWECRNMPKEAQMDYLQDAANVISNARPTTAKRMAVLCNSCLQVAQNALKQDRNVADAIVAHTVDANNRRYRQIEEIAKHLTAKFPQNGTVMTHCFAETIVGMMLKQCQLQNSPVLPRNPTLFSRRSPHCNRLP